MIHLVIAFVLLAIACTGLLRLVRNTRRAERKESARIYPGPVGRKRLP